MKISTPQILWHNGSDNGRSAPIYSLSMIECNGEQILATAGNTSEVHLWKLSSLEQAPEQAGNARILQTTAQKHKISHHYTLNRHDSSVNVVKFNGRRLATASDGGSIIVWTCDDWSTLEKESDVSLKIINCGLEGILDLDFSGGNLVVGSVSHAVAVYDPKWKCIYRSTRDHTHYVQGVAYDPMGVYIASMASDRTVQIHSLKKKKRTEFRKTKVIKYHKEEDKPKQYLFAEESAVASFFRRLSWTHDGVYLIAPAGLWQSNSSPMQDDESSKTTFATHIFCRHKFDEPYKVLPGLEKPSVAICPNPVKFELPHKENRSPNKTLGYRSIFAVLTLDTVLIYDTEQNLPLAVARGLHYAGLTDATWSADGQSLLVSSTDGYISIISFQDGELGTPIPQEQPVLVVLEEKTPPLEKKQALPLIIAKPSTPLAPCEPGQAATLEAPPPKRLKVEEKKLQSVGAGVTNLQIEDNTGPPAKKKKRITPLLIQ